MFASLIGDLLKHEAKSSNTTQRAIGATLYWSSSVVSHCLLTSIQSLLTFLKSSEHLISDINLSYLVAEFEYRRGVLLHRMILSRGTLFITLGSQKLSVWLDHTQPENIKNIYTTCR
jgi:hypothetical protein